MSYLDEPDDRPQDPTELLLRYLDYYRDTVRRKLDGMTETDLRRSRLPSGWAPLALVAHLSYMERRWIEWGFAGEQVADPWGDTDPVTDRWTVAEDNETSDVLTRLRDTGRRTRQLAGTADLTAPARTGGRFPPGTDPPTLFWILLHVLQEYARHAGHLDIARELVDGTIGE